jgi:hypothetical protein
MTPVAISVYNQAKTALPVPLSQLVPALQAYVDQYLGPVWNVACVLTETQGPVLGTWGIVFLDTADVQGALAYHEDDGLPLSKVFVETTLQAGESVSVSASHELAEMLVDPNCNAFVMDPAGVLYCLEAADPVEETTFDVNGIAMSDFVYPAWFGEPGAAQFDHVGVLDKPFELAKGGYATTAPISGQPTQIFGSAEKAARYAAEDRRGRRGALRTMRLAGTRT